MAPFLEILTRCYKRPDMLAVNQASLRAQTDDDWLQTLLIDDQGRGIGWSSENLGRYAAKLSGLYVWILDDDDQCTLPDLVQRLRKIVCRHNPDVIMMRMDHQERGILPDADHWGKPPEHGHIGASAYVVRREIWQHCAWAWSPGVYHSDFNFIRAVYETQPSVYWWQVVASRVQRVSLGQPERIQ